MRFKIIFTDYVYPDINSEKKVLGKINCKIEVLQTKSVDELKKKCIDADALIVQYAPITKEVIDKLPSCKVISRYGIGTDNIDIELATKKGIIVCNAPDFCLEEVAEHTLALIMSLNRKIINSFKSVKEGLWHFLDTKVPPLVLKESVLGIIGFGKIPQNLYSKVCNLFKEILVYDPYVDHKIIKKYDLDMVNFNKILELSDFLSIHCPLNKETYHMFGQGEFNHMKSKAYIINTSRGPIIDSEALYQALVNNSIAGAGLDTVEGEPLDKDDRLLKLDNVIVTPHIAFYSKSSLAKLQYTTALNVLKVLEGKKPINVVNKEVLKKN